MDLSMTAIEKAVSVRKESTPICRSISIRFGGEVCPLSRLEKQTGGAPKRTARIFLL